VKRGREIRVKRGKKMGRGKRGRAGIGKCLQQQRESRGQRSEVFL